MADFDIEYQKLCAINSFESNTFALAVDTIGGRNGIYKTSNISEEIKNLFHTIQRNVDFGNIYFFLLDKILPIKLPNVDCNVIQHCWILLSTYVRPSTLARLIHELACDEIYAFNPKSAMPILNSIPNGFDMNNSYASIDSLQQSRRYFIMTIYAYVSMYNARDAPFIFGMHPNVLNSLSFNLTHSKSFLDLQPWKQEHDPRILSFLQSASFEKLELLLLSTMGQYDYNCLSVDVQRIYDSFMHSPAQSKQAINDILPNLQFLDHTVKHFIQEMVYCLGAHSFLHLWILLKYPCCRVTYEPLIDCLWLVHKPEFLNEYQQSYVICCQEYFRREFTDWIDLFSLNINLPVSIKLPDQSQYLLSMNEYIAIHMYGPNPFGCNSLLLNAEYINIDPDHGLIYRTKTYITGLDETTFGYKWTDDINKLQDYSYRHAVAMKYVEFLIYHEVINNVEADAFMLFIAECSLQHLLWLQGLSRMLDT